MARPHQFSFDEMQGSFLPDEAINATLVPQGVRLPSYIRDHRKRLRRRFLDGGADALPDYELLELVLIDEEL